MNIRDRFESKHIPEPNSGCWLWTGSLDGSGHSKLKVGGRLDSGHRLSYRLHKGTIPPGMVVRHRCDVRSCVNPGHLVLGTVADNNADRARRRSRK